MKRNLNYRKSFKTRNLNKNTAKNRRIKRFYTATLLQLKTKLKQSRSSLINKCVCDLTAEFKQ